MLVKSCMLVAKCTCTMLWDLGDGGVYFRRGAAEAKAARAREMKLVRNIVLGTEKRRITERPLEEFSSRVLGGVYKE
jgi:uncharacterized protein YehS (DUF1456 family)